MWRHRWITVTETLLSSKSKIFTIWTFTEKVSQLQSIIINAIFKHFAFLLGTVHFEFHTFDLVIPHNNPTKEELSLSTFHRKETVKSGLFYPKSQSQRMEEPGFKSKSNSTGSPKRKAITINNLALSSSVQLLSSVNSLTLWAAACQATPVHHQLPVFANSYPLSWRCHPTISSSVTPFPPAFNLYNLNFCLANPEPACSALWVAVAFIKFLLFEKYFILKEYLGM